MKRILSILVSFVLCLNVFNYDIFANEIKPTAVVCEIIEGYAVKSKTTSYNIEHTAVLINDRNYEVYGHAEFSRTVETSISGSINLELIEDLLGLEAEIASGNSSTLLLSTDPPIPAKSTVYVDFGYRYVNASIQWQTRNSDCSITWSGPITTAWYTTESFMRIR